MLRTTAENGSRPAPRKLRDGSPGKRWIVLGKRRSALLVALFILVLVSAASADVRWTGQWPETEPPVSLSVEGKPRGAAIRQLAEVAGWSLMQDSPAQDSVDLMVKDQAPTKVLETLLREGHWIAHREGNLVSITREAGAAAEQKPPGAGSAVAPPAPSASAVAPAPAAASGKRGADRVVAGNNATIQAGEVVRDLVVFGGSAEVLGTVTGDLVVFGGTATVRSGGRVQGDGVVFGGFLDIEAGGEVDGNEVAFGGSVRKNGEVVSGGFPLGPDGKWQTEPWSGPSVAAKIAHRVATSALLFLFGALLLAVARQRMEALEVAFIARPLRSVVQGFLAGLLLLVACVVLAVTCIGIPIAGALLLLALFASGAGLCAILVTVGAALIQHRSRSPYAQLAVGCILFLVLGLIPFLGPVGSFLLKVAGLGVVVLTRGAGLWPAPARV